MRALLYPLTTEKALNAIDKHNTISYIVDMRVGKKQIKEEFENIFKVKTERINTTTTMNNTKKAYIKIKKEYKASDIARKLKLV
jgi:large subunit ribosomal protein L23